MLRSNHLRGGAPGEAGGRAPALWRASVLCFLVAAATGALLRFGFWIGLPWSLEAANVRHAHSHLMYFSWATPAIFALVGSALCDKGRMEAGVPRWGLRWGLPGWCALLLGLASYPFFLIAGYGRVPLFGASPPMASILSGLTIFTWYGFAVWYARRRRRAPRTRSLLLSDTALFGLLLSTAGAWGRAALQFSGTDAPFLEDLFVYLFLGAFSEGWLLLGVLGLAFVGSEALPGTASFGTASFRAKEAFPGGESDAAAAKARWLLWAGLPWAPFLGTGVFSDLSGPGGAAGALDSLVRVGGSLFLAGLAIHAGALGRAVRLGRRREWVPFLIFFLAHLFMQAGLIVPGVAEWGERLGLRVLYLHVLALGAVSSGLFAAARERWGEGASPSPWAFGAGVLVLLGGLVALALPLPPGDTGASRRAIAAWTSIAPILPVAAYVPKALLSRRRSREAGGAI